MNAERAAPRILLRTSGPLASSSRGFIFKFFIASFCLTGTAWYHIADTKVPRRTRVGFDVKDVVMARLGAISARNDNEAGEVMQVGMLEGPILPTLLKLALPTVVVLVVQ